MPLESWESVFVILAAIATIVGVIYAIFFKKDIEHKEKLNFNDRINNKRYDKYCELSKLIEEYYLFVTKETDFKKRKEDLLEYSNALLEYYNKARALNRNISIVPDKVLRDLVKDFTDKSQIIGGCFRNTYYFKSYSEDELEQEKQNYNCLFETLQEVGELRDSIVEHIGQKYPEQRNENA